MVCMVMVDVKGGWKREDGEGWKRCCEVEKLNNEQRKMEGKKEVERGWSLEVKRRKRKL